MSHRQLDIFDDSRETQLRNDLASALLRDDIAGARKACAALAQEFPADDALATAPLLLRAIEHAPALPFATHAQAEEACRRLAEEVEPAARRVLGPAAAAAWLARRWAALAQCAAPLPFAAAHQATHPAALWLRAGEWKHASDAVAGIPAWRRIPIPLAWMAQARYREDGLDVIWELLAELAWLSPRLMDEVLRALADPLLRKLQEAFGSVFDGGIEELAWFPAWLLIEQPSLARHLALAQRGTFTPPEQAMRLLLELLGLERQGRQREAMERRKSLRDGYPALHACYMARR